MRAMAVAVLSLLMLAYWVAESSADEMKRFDKATNTCRIFTDRNVWAGYENFRAVCKRCHSRENDQGAPFLFTESKTRKGWDRVLAKRYPECAKNGAWDSLSDADRENINDYLFVNAAGTYNPNCAA